MGGIGNKLPLLDPGLLHGTDGQLCQKDGDEQEAQEGENRHQKTGIEQVPHGAQCAGNIGEYQNIVHTFRKAVPAVPEACGIFSILGICRSNGIACIILRILGGVLHGASEVAESVFIDDACRPF